MEPGPILAERWPNRLLELRRKCAINPDFREILSDYLAAREALEHWRAVDPENSRKIADYDSLVREIEAEIEKGLT